MQAIIQCRGRRVRMRIKHASRTDRNLASDVMALHARRRIDPMRSIATLAVIHHTARSAM
jgi:hypothetical protein